MTDRAFLMHLQSCCEEALAQHHRRQAEMTERVCLTVLSDELYRIHDGINAHVMNAAPPTLLMQSLVYDQPAPRDVMQ